MKTEKILTMIEEGKTEDLKKMLQDEIYMNSLKVSGRIGSSQRYAAMKRYFKYSDPNKDKRTAYPCKDIEVNNFILNGKFNCFASGCSIVLTTEDIGELDDFKSVAGGQDYYNIGNFIGNYNNDPQEIDINEVLAKAKSMGYKFSKQEVVNSCKNKFKYLWKFWDIYGKIGILDQAFGIINDGEPAKVWSYSPKAPILIGTSIGFALVLPIVLKEEEKHNFQIIEMD